MKTFKLALLVVIILCACSEPKRINDLEISAIKGKVDTLLNNWHQAATDADFDAYFGVIDSISVIIGTDATEYWTKQQFEKFCEPHFDKGEAWDFKTLERHLYVSNTADVVWFDELLDTWMGPCRGSGVLEKSDEVWKMKQYIFSVTVPNDDIHEVIKVKYESDSIFLRKVQAK